MKAQKIVLALALLLFGWRNAPAGNDTGFDRVNFSVTLSGHVLVGVGFEHGFNAHHALQVKAFPLVVPGKGFPFAFSAGYNYYTKGVRWRGKIGANFTLLVSPPDPVKRKWMPMLVLAPGVQYGFNETNSLTFQPWLAYFLAHANRRFAPIGLEFIYGRNF